MKILLIRPSERDYSTSRLPDSLNNIQGNYPPLGLMYLASVLRVYGYNVKIIDCQISNHSSSFLKKEISRFKPDITGISTMTPYFYEAYNIAKLVKSFGSVTVLGGPHVSVSPNDIVSEKYIDFAIIGDAEYNFLSLVQNLEKKKRGELDNISGLVYTKNGKIRINKLNYIKDLNKLPFPSRDILSAEKYYCILNNNKYTTLITSRGCPYNCSFCFKKRFDNIFRKRNAKNVADEIELCIDQYGIKEIMFYDEAFSFNKKHVISICNELISRNLDVKWEATFRVGDANKDLLKLMFKAGCFRLRYGVESGNQTTLNMMNKNIKLQQVKKAFLITKKTGIETLAYFMIGYIGEGAQSVQNTINFSKQINPDWALFLATTPLPLTPLFKEAVEKGLINNDYWKHPINKNKPHLIKDCDKFVREAYFSFYLRIPYILKKIYSSKSRYQILNYYKGLKNIISM